MKKPIIISDKNKKSLLIKKIISNILKWCPRPDSNWHSASGKDFKSFVSTNFTTRAFVNFMSVYANIYNWTRWISKFFLLISILILKSLMVSNSLNPLLSHTFLNHWIIFIGKSKQLIFRFSEHSRKWRDMGGKIFADLTSELSHLGKFSFYGSPSFNLKKN